MRYLSLPKSSIAGLPTWLRTRLELARVAVKGGFAAIAFTGAAVGMELGIPSTNSLLRSTLIWNSYVGWLDVCSPLRVILQVDMILYTQKVTQPSLKG